MALLKKMILGVVMLLLTSYGYSQRVNADFQQMADSMRLKKREVHPKSIFFSGGVGSFLAINKVDDPSNFIHSGGVPSLTGYLMVEAGFKNDFYLEAGLSLETANNVFKNEIFGTSGGNVFTSKKLSLGVSKRITHKKTGINYINIHAGFAGSLHYNRLFDSATFEMFVTHISQNDTSYLYAKGKGNYYTTFFPTLYIALEKDFRVSESFYISLKYRRDLGFVKVYNEDIYYHYSNTTPPTSNSELNHATAYINGSAHTLTIGLKYKFLGKKHRGVPPTYNYE